MKIAKSFEDNETVIIYHHPLSPATTKVYVHWAIDERGNLFYKKISINPTPSDRIWVDDNKWEDYRHATFGIPILVMQKIISKFGNLLPFI